MMAWLHIGIIPTMIFPQYEYHGPDDGPSITHVAAQMVLYYARYGRLPTPVEGAPTSPAASHRSTSGHAQRSSMADSLLPPRSRPKPQRPTSSPEDEAGRSAGLPSGTNPPRRRPVKQPNLGFLLKPDPDPDLALQPGVSPPPDSHAAAAVPPAAAPSHAPRLAALQNTALLLLAQASKHHTPRPQSPTHNTARAAARKTQSLNPGRGRSTRGRGTRAHVRSRQRAGSAPRLSSAPAPDPADLPTLPPAPAPVRLSSACLPTAQQMLKMGFRRVPLAGVGAGIPALTFSGPRPGLLPPSLVPPGAVEAGAMLGGGGGVVQAGFGGASGGGGAALQQPWAAPGAGGRLCSGPPHQRVRVRHRVLSMPEPLLPLGSSSPSWAPMDRDPGHNASLAFDANRFSTAARAATKGMPPFPSSAATFFSRRAMAPADPDDAAKVPGMPHNDDAAEVPGMPHKARSSAPGGAAGGRRRSSYSGVDNGHKGVSEGGGTGGDGAAGEKAAKARVRVRVRTAPAAAAATAGAHDAEPPRVMRRSGSGYEAAGSVVSAPGEAATRKCSSRVRVPSRKLEAAVADAGGCIGRELLGAGAHLGTHVGLHVGGGAGRSSGGGAQLHIKAEGEQGVPGRGARRGEEAEGEEVVEKAMEVEAGGAGEGRAGQGGAGQGGMLLI